MTKLHDVAYGRDAEGCFKEPSARIRQAAANALNACRDATGSETNVMPVEEPLKPEKETPLEPIPTQKEACLDEPGESLVVWIEDVEPAAPDKSAAPAETDTPSRADEDPAASLVQPAGYSGIRLIRPPR